jgi:hypothetical protein
MEQTGAIIGPLPVSAALSLHYNYAQALSSLIVLALVSITAVFVARSFRRVTSTSHPHISAPPPVFLGGLDWAAVGWSFADLG